MNTAVNPEFNALRDKVESQSIEIAELRGNVQQLDKIVSATTRQSIWQLIVLIISLCGAIVGGLAYQTTMIDKRIEQMERRLDLLERNLTTRIQSSEQNLNVRFEDFKQEIRAQHQ